MVKLIALRHFTFDSANLNLTIFEDTQKSEINT